MNDDLGHMAHALRLAARGLGNAWPNPAVGCVIVRGDRVVGRGWTAPGGRPHAETQALAQAGEAARGATAHVTLEPCAHHGRTPPCAAALVTAGVARVVTACTDPDPRVQGRGHAMLRAAGIEVVEGVRAAEAQRLNEGFFRRIRLGRPHVTLKLALTLDGRIAGPDGVSRWITGEGSRRAVHAMRAAHDAVMVGIGTALADDPDLTVRGLGPLPRPPVRVVLDSRLRLPPGGRLASSAGAVPVWVLHAEGAAVPAALAATQVRLLPCPADAAGRVDIAAALARLGNEGLTRVLCEGGAGLAAALLAAGEAGEIVAFTAGHAFGAEGLPAVAALPAPPPGRRALDPPGWRLEDSRRLGSDLMHRWRPAPA